MRLPTGLPVRRPPDKGPARAGSGWLNRAVPEIPLRRKASVRSTVGLRSQNRRTTASQQAGPFGSLRRRTATGRSMPVVHEHTASRPLQTLPFRCSLGYNRSSNVSCDLVPFRGSKGAAPTQWQNCVRVVRGPIRGEHGVSGLPGYDVFAGGDLAFPSGVPCAGRNVKLRIRWRLPHGTRLACNQRGLLRSLDEQLRIGADT